METRTSHLIMESKQIKCFHVFKDHNLGVSDFSQNKLKPSEIATTSFDTDINIYDLDKMTNVANLTNHEKGVWTCDYSMISPLLLSGSNDNTIILWDTKNYKPISDILYHNEVVYDVKFSSNGNLFASCSKGMICIWDLKNLKEPLNTIKDQQNDFIYSLNFIEFDKFIVSGFMDGCILIAEINNIKDFKKYDVPKEFNSLQVKEPSSTGNSVSQISKFKRLSQFKDDEMLTSHDDGTVRQWSCTDGIIKENKKFNYFNKTVTSANSSFDDLMLVAGSKDHSALVWDINEENKINYTLVGHSDVVTCADFISNDVVATSSYDTTFRLWKLDKI